jgi:hypothetical protein
MACLRPHSIVHLGERALFQTIESGFRTIGPSWPRQKKPQLNAKGGGLKGNVFGSYPVKPRLQSTTFREIHQTLPGNLTALTIPKNMLQAAAVVSLRRAVVPRHFRRRTIAKYAAEDCRATG